VLGFFIKAWTLPNKLNPKNFQENNIKNEPYQREESQGYLLQWQARGLEVLGSQVPCASKMQGVQGNPSGTVAIPKMMKSLISQGLMRKHKMRIERRMN